MNLAPEKVRELYLLARKFRDKLAKVGKKKGDSVWETCSRCKGRFKPERDKEKPFPEGVTAYDRAAFCGSRCAHPNPGVIGATRQTKRQYLRLKAHAKIQEVAGGEPRKIRRAMARDLAKNWYTGKVEKSMAAGA